VEASLILARESGGKQLSGEDFCHKMWSPMERVVQLAEQPTVWVWVWVWTLDRSCRYGNIKAGRRDMTLQDLKFL
jgi:hypothetical protein